MCATSFRPLLNCARYAVKEAAIGLSGQFNIKFTLSIGIEARIEVFWARWSGDNPRRSSVLVCSKCHPSAQWPDEWSNFLPKAADLGVATSRQRSGVHRQVKSIWPLRQPVAPWGPSKADLTLTEHRRWGQRCSSARSSNHCAEILVHRFLETDRMESGLS